MFLHKYTSCNHHSEFSFWKVIVGAMKTINIQEKSMETSKEEMTVVYVKEIMESWTKMITSWHGERCKLETGVSISRWNQ